MHGYGYAVQLDVSDSLLPYAHPNVGATLETSPTQGLLAHAHALPPQWRFRVLPMRL